MRKILLIALFFTISAPTFAQQKDAKYYYETAMKQSDLKKVISNFSKAIELQPNYTEAIYYRGVAYFHSKDFTKALADFNKVTQIDSKHYGALAYRGRTKDALKKSTEALADLNAALALNAKYGEGHYFRGLYYKSHGNAAKACTDFNQAKKNGYSVPEPDMNGCSPVKTNKRD